MRAVVSDLFEIGHWGLGMGGGAVVIEPEELKQYLNEKVRDKVF